MSIYEVLFFYFCMVSFIDFNKNRKLSKLFFFISFFILIIFAGIRFDTGWDYPGYQFYYEKIPSLPEITLNYDDFDSIYFEPGFKVLMSILKSLGVEFQGLIFIVNLITTSLFFVFIKRTGKVIGYENIMVLLYFSTVFLYTNFSVLRQGIAIGIWLYSLSYLNKSITKYLFLLFCGLCFHYSLAIFIILPVFTNIIKPKLKLILILMSISLLIYILGIQWLKGISSFLPDSFSSKLEFYWGSDRFGSERSLGVGFLEKLITLMSICYFYFYKLKDANVSKEYNSYILVYLLYFICYMIFFEITVVYDRTRLYFASFSISILPFLLLFFNSKSKLLITLLIMGYSLFFFNNTISSEQNKIVFIPYHTVFDDIDAIPEYQKGRARTELGMDIDHNNFNRKSNEN